jgi:hypothetical protein
MAPMTACVSAVTREAGLFVLQRPLGWRDIQRGINLTVELDLSSFPEY